MGWKPGQSGNPKGRKADARLAKVREAIAKAAPDLIASLIEQARNGDVSAAKMLLDRYLPAFKPETRPSPTPMPTEPDQILTAVASGQLTLDQAESLMSLRLSEARIRETKEIAERLDAIEGALAELRNLPPSSP